MAQELVSQQSESPSAGLSLRGADWKLLAGTGRSGGRGWSKGTTPREGPSMCLKWGLQPEAVRAVLQVRKLSLWSTPQGRQLHPSHHPRDSRQQTAEIRTRINSKVNRVSDVSWQNSVFSPIFQRKCEQTTKNCQTLKENQHLQRETLNSTNRKPNPKETLLTEKTKTT